MVPHQFKRSKHVIRALMSRESCRRLEVWQPVLRIDDLCTSWCATASDWFAASNKHMIWQVIDSCAAQGDAGAHVSER